MLKGCSLDRRIIMRSKGCLDSSKRVNPRLGVAPARLEPRRTVVPRGPRDGEGLGVRISRIRGLDPPRRLEEGRPPTPWEARPLERPIPPDPQYSDKGIPTQDLDRPIRSGVAL